MKFKGATRSISTKMSLISAAVMFTCTMTTVGVFMVGNFRQSVEAEQTRLQSVASIFAAVLSKPVADNDKVGAREALRALRDLPRLTQASVNNAKGDLIAEMGGGAVLERTVSKSADIGIVDLLSIDTLDIAHVISNNGAHVGQFHMTVDISWMKEMFLRRFLFAALFALTAIGAGFLIGRQLVRRATRPLADLAGTLSGIGASETLHYNFKRVSDDEVGVLIDAFNDMMGRIDERDRALRAYSDSLEETVQHRTAELVTARDEAERANAAKSEFLSMMSHEIRTPMNGMMVMAQMLAAAPLSPRHLRFAEIINRSGQNLLSIINDVLDISKIEAGRLDLEKVPFSLDQLFADVYGLFSERARERDIFLGFSVAPNVPSVLIGDPTRLNQIVTNLVNNALKFTEKGGVIMRASATGAGDNVSLVLSVEDTGIGIASDKLAQVFERFAQADQSITRRFGGTGLGLAISKRLVEAMDGTISVKSAEGKGSVFTATVNLQADGEAEQPFLFRGRNVAIETASPMLEMLLGEIFNARGAQLVAIDGHARPDLVLTDRESSMRANGPVCLFMVPALDVAETSYRNRTRLEFPVPCSRESLALLARAGKSGDYAQFQSLRRSTEHAQSFDEFRGLSALAVDDNSVNREVLNEALSAMGIHVDNATNGEEAVSLAKANRYDIIFMDCSMPVMDGFAATRIIREHEALQGRRTPIVAITALSESTGDKNWRKNGMDGWISKPFTIPAVSDRISNLVLQHRRGKADTVDAPIPGVDQLPMLDEPTVAMIARLSSGGDNGAAKRIFALFSTESATALAALADTDGGQQDFAIYLQSLKSVSQSAGARRLAAAAEHLENRAKLGQPLNGNHLKVLTDIAGQTEHDLSARLGISADRQKTGT